MPALRHVHTIPLARNSDYLAHVDNEDFRVLFTRRHGGQAPDPARGSAALAAAGALLDEHQPRDPSRRGKRTLTLYLVLSDRCNLGCTYCDVLGRPDQRLPGQDMDWPTARRALDILQQRLQADPALEAQVTFFGGEPLLAWPLLQRICQTLAAWTENPRISRMLVSNGTLLDEEKAAFLLAHRVYVVVSLDGRPATNGRMRHGLDGADCYPRVARGLTALQAVMPGRFGISCTVGSHNAATLDDELRHLQQSWQPLCIGLNLYHYQRDGRCALEMDEKAQVNAMLDAFRLTRREGISIYQYIGMLKAFVRRRRNLDYCPACVDKLLFSPAGRVGRCETLMADPRFSVPLAQVGDDGRLPPHLDWTRHTPEHEPACQGCAARWICAGSCAYDQWVTTGQLCGVQTRRCTFHRGMLVEMLDLLLESCRDERGDGPVLLPAQRHFDAVPGRSPTSFPADTIWIVQMAGVDDGEGP